MNLYSYIQDFGLCDKILARKNEKARSKVIGNTDYKRIEVEKWTDSSVWVVFLPWRTSFEDAEKLRFLPNEWRIIVYEWPIWIANPDPKITLQLLGLITDDIDSLQLSEFNVLSFSVGNYPWFYVANNFKTNKFVSVLPWSKLWESIYNGIATRGVKDRSIQLGIKKPEEYDSIIAGTNPIENIHNLSSNFEIYVAWTDYFIPTRYAEELIAEIWKKWLTPKIVRYKNKGHVLSLLQFWHEKRW